MRLLFIGLGSAALASAVASCSTPPERPRALGGSGDPGYGLGRDGGSASGGNPGESGTTTGGGATGGGGSGGTTGGGSGGTTGGGSGGTTGGGSTGGGTAGGPPASFAQRSCTAYDPDKIYLLGLLYPTSNFDLHASLDLETGLWCGVVVDTILPPLQSHPTPHPYVRIDGKLLFAGENDGKGHVFEPDPAGLVIGPTGFAWQGSAMPGDNDTLLTPGCTVRGMLMSPERAEQGYYCGNTSFRLPDGSDGGAWVRSFGYGRHLLKEPSVSPPTSAPTIVDSVGIPTAPFTQLTGSVKLAIRAKPDAFHVAVERQTAPFPDELWSLKFDGTPEKLGDYADPPAGYSEYAFTGETIVKTWASAPALLPDGTLYETVFQGTVGCVARRPLAPAQSSIVWCDDNKAVRSFSSLLFTGP